MFKKKCAIPTDLDFGVLSIKSMFFVYFWAKNKPQLKFFNRDMVYIILIHLLNQVTLDMISVYKYFDKLT